MDPAFVDPKSELRAELLRLQEKLSTVSDPDIRTALSARISQIHDELGSSTASEVSTSGEETVTPLTDSELRERRAELARVSGQLYSTEDPEVRTQLQQRVRELQGLLNIDVAKLAGGELAQNAVPEPQPTSKRSTKETKGRVDMAELQALVAEKSALIRKTENSTEIDLPESTEPPTPEQQETAEKLIQQARVEKMRGNKAEVQRLLEQAAKSAPTSPTVLEMVGDDYAERRQLGKAVAYYRRAAKLDPKNVNIERKLAVAALGVNTSDSGQMLSTLDESAIPMASRNAAMLLSLFLPGLGHIVLGQKSKGWPILVFWCLLLAWVILQGSDVAKLGSMIVGGRSQPNMIVAVPLFLMVVTYIATLADFRGPKETARKPIDRPQPPVNLPFE